MKDWIVDCSNCNRRSARNQKNHPRKAHATCDLTSADSRFQLDSGDRAKRLSSEGSAPRTFQLGRRCVETSGDVTDVTIKPLPNKSRGLLRAGHDLMRRSGVALLHLILKFKMQFLPSNGQFGTDQSQLLNSLMIADKLTVAQANRT
jgi:hypothetical protein